jgi:hypothetical protein
MGKKGMRTSQELSTHAAPWEEQAAFSHSYRFNTSYAEGAEQDETFLLMVGSQRDETVTITDYFSSGSEAISGQGSLTLYDFTGRASQHSQSISNVIVATPFDWPLRAKQWRRLDPGAFLNTVLWIDGYRRSEPREDTTRRINSVFSEEVFTFSAEHRIFGYLQFTLNLVAQYFPSTLAIYVEKEYDPESDDEWLLVTAKLHESIEVVLNQYDAYTRCFINSIPWPQRNKIRFNYDLS